MKRRKYLKDFLFQISKPGQVNADTEVERNPKEMKQIERLIKGAKR